MIHRQEIACVLSDYCLWISGRDVISNHMVGAVYSAATCFELKCGLRELLFQVLLRPCCCALLRKRKCG